MPVNYNGEGLELTCICGNEAFRVTIQPKLVRLSRDVDYEIPVLIATCTRCPAMVFIESKAAGQSLEEDREEYDFGGAVHDMHERMVRTMMADFTYLKSDAERHNQMRQEYRAREDYEQVVRAWNTWDEGAPE